MSTSISQLRRRAVRSPRTAFVLAGGGNQAVCQVGMLKALLERDIVPDVLVGTSAGACNASVIAAMPNLAGVERLVETWESLRGDEVFPGGRLSRAWNLLTRDDHLFDNDGLRALIARSDTPKTFDELLVPLRVVACDLDTGAEVVFAAGPARTGAPGQYGAPGLVPADPLRRAGAGRRCGGRHGAAVARAGRSGGPRLRAQHRQRAPEPLPAVADRRRHSRVRDQPQAALRTGAAERAGKRRRGRAVGADRQPRGHRLLRSREADRPVVSPRREIARRRRARQAEAAQPASPLVARVSGLASMG